MPNRRGCATTIRVRCIGWKVSRNWTSDGRTIRWRCRKPSPRIEREDFHLIGTLADTIKSTRDGSVPSKASLDSSLQSILVPTPDDAIRAAGWLKNNHAGRANFLVTGLHGGSDEVDVDIDELTYFRPAETTAEPRQYAAGGN